jgi:hypothetical protein
MYNSESKKEFKQSLLLPSSSSLSHQPFFQNQRLQHNDIIFNNHNVNDNDNNINSNRINDKNKFSSNLNNNQSSFDSCEQDNFNFDLLIRIELIKKFHKLYMNHILKLVSSGENSYCNNNNNIKSGIKKMQFFYLNAIEGYQRILNQVSLLIRFKIDDIDRMNKSSHLTLKKKLKVLNDYIHYLIECTKKICESMLDFF